MPRKPLNQRYTVYPGPFEVNKADHNLINSDWPAHSRAVCLHPELHNNHYSSLPREARFGWSFYLGGNVFLDRSLNYCKAPQTAGEGRKM